MTTPNAQSWTPAVSNYIKLLADEFVKSNEEAATNDPDEVDFPGYASTDTPFSRLSRYLASEESDCMAPATSDTNHPISDYFISSSHNTYLWGNQLYGKASTEAYRNVLERGCRCVEIDVWDGESDSDESNSSSGESSGGEGEGEIKKLRRKFKRKVGVLKGSVSGSGSVDEKQAPLSGSSVKGNSLRKSPSNKTEPRVLHGYTATREVSFRDVCMAIRDHAFAHSDLPLIVSLEVHACPEQQQLMVDIIKEYWTPYLVSQKVLGKGENSLPTLEELRKKILIKVKYSSPNSATATRPASGSKTNEPESSEDEAQNETTKKSNIILALGSMGIYTRSYHFKGLDQPEAKIPTHVFSLSEKKLMEIHKRDASAIFSHNKRFMLRVYPKGVRVSSSNLDPAPFWRMGAQIVALNWQYVNAATMLNQGMFHSTGGWVLKPEGYRSWHTAKSQLSALRRGRLDLSIEVFAGQNIGLVGNKLRPYIRCELHVEDFEEVINAEIPDGGKSKDGQIKQSTEVGQGGRHPDFSRHILQFKDVPSVSEELTFVRFKVMDDDTFSRDDLVAWACFRLDRLRTGIRTLRLYSLDGQRTDGTLLVRISKNLKME